MQKIKVEKPKLLAILQKNRDAHHAIFLEAQKGFRKTVIQELEKRLELARAGKRVDQYLRLPEPVDRTRDYDRVISMLKMDLTDTVELSETDYSQYVMDDWEWKREFLGTNQAYSLKAAKLAQSSLPGFCGAGSASCHCAFSLRCASRFRCSANSPSTTFRSDVSQSW